MLADRPANATLVSSPLNVRLPKLLSEEEVKALLVSPTGVLELYQILYSLKLVSVESAAVGKPKVIAETVVVTAETLSGAVGAVVSMVKAEDVR